MFSTMIALVLAVSLQQLQPASAGAYLDLVARTNRNLLRLSCLDQETGLPFAFAAFFLNDTLFYDLLDPVEVSEDRPVSRVFHNNEDIFFTINPQAEGYYHCAVPVLGTGGLLSSVNSIPFVALPPTTAPLLPRPTPVNAPINSEARIDCSNQPGAMIEQYYITWRNSSSGEILADIPNPVHEPNSLPFRRDPRYNIDNTTLALVISNATLLDSGAFYSCELGVISPQEISTIFTYPESASIELLVYEPSVITSGPSSLVLSADTTPNTATFRCSAEGSDRPIIVWRLGGKNITQGNGHVIFEEFSTTSTGRRHVDSELTVLDLDAHDTGVVECLADTRRSSATNFQRLPGDAASADLTVLGVFNELKVFITTTSDVIFFLTYPATPLHPVQLRLLYHEEDGDRTSLTIPSTVYMNSSEINYIAFSATVPFDRFSVEIALVHGSVVGPGKSDMRVYDKRIPSSIGMIIRDTVLQAMIPAVFIIAVFIIATLIIVLRYCKYRSRFRTNSKIADKRNEDITKTLDNLNYLLRTVDHSSDNFLRLLEAVKVAHDRQLWYINSKGELARPRVASDDGSSRYVDMPGKGGRAIQMTAVRKFTPALVESPSGTAVANLSEPERTKVESTFADVACIMVSMGTRSPTKSINPHLREKLMAMKVIELMKPGKDDAE